MDKILELFGINPHGFNTIAQISNITIYGEAAIFAQMLVIEVEETIFLIDDQKNLWKSELKEMKVAVPYIAKYWKY